MKEKGSDRAEERHKEERRGKKNNYDWKQLLEESLPWRYRQIEIQTETIQLKKNEVT